MIVGARQDGLSVSETADLLGFSRTTFSGVSENDVKNKKTSSSVGINVLLMSGMQKSIPEHTGLNKSPPKSKINTQ